MLALALFLARRLDKVLVIETGVFLNICNIRASCHDAVCRINSSEMFAHKLYVLLVILAVLAAMTSTALGQHYWTYESCHRRCTGGGHCRVSYYSAPHCRCVCMR